MSLLLLFRGAVPSTLGRYPTSSGEGGKTFLHEPTTSTVQASLPELLQTFIGNAAELEYDFEEIRRRTLAIVLNQGQDVLILPRLTKGTRCPFWKSEEEQCEKPLDRTAKCYNTGWIGGYSTSIPIKIVLAPANRTSVTYASGVRKLHVPKSWTMHVPVLRERDLVVSTYNGVRYQIQNVTDVRWRGLVVYQEFELLELTRGGSASYAYSVPVPTPLP